MEVESGDAQTRLKEISVQARRSTSISKQERLPGPEGAPFCWADSRQELCESLPYYRSFHSGCYATSALTPSSNLKRAKNASNTLRDKTPYGYLLAGFGSSRDAWEQSGKVIISHGGGKSGSTTSSNLKDTVSRANGKYKKHNGAVRLVADQTMDDNRVSCLLHSYRQQTPIVLLIARDYKLSHFELPCAFAVLGWYWITDTWCEREGCSRDDQSGWVRWKFRFQYIESQGSPWWLKDENVKCWSPSNSTMNTFSSPVERFKKRKRTSSELLSWSSNHQLRKPVGLSSLPIPEYTGQGFDCSVCGQLSPVVFTRGWMCLFASCKVFWKLRGGVPIEEDLIINHTFFELRPEPLHFAHGGVPFTLGPSLSNASQKDDEGDLLRGLHCTCGRLTCRQYAHHWSCAHCGFTKPCHASSQTHASSLTASTSRLEDSKVNIASGIVVVYKRLPEVDLEVGSFIFPENLGGGSVHLIQSMSGEDKEANDIFAQMQKSAEGRGESLELQSDIIPFQRHPLNCGTVKGDLLSQQFTCNYGVEYKHTVKMGTIALQDAPSSILKALEYIKQRTRKVVGNTRGGNDINFNEIYPVKYLETQKMNFHDDGEPGLGPIVSSLSLGRQAKMMFRLKEKYTTDFKRRGGAADDDTTQDGSVQNKLGENIRLGEQTLEVENEKSKIKSQLDGEIKHTAVSMSDRVLLTIPLRHGSVAIQEGRRLQEMVEHAVQPLMEQQESAGSKIRIALTARRIDKECHNVVQPTEKVPTLIPSPAVTVAPKTNIVFPNPSKERKAMAIQSVMKLPGGAGWSTNFQSPLR